MARCHIAGPYLPAGDVDWECRTHKVDAVLRDTTRAGAPDLRREDFTCPQARAVFVIAGNHRQGVEWVRSERLNPREAIIVDSVRDLRGVQLDPEDVVRVGTWSERRDLPELDQQIAVASAHYWSLRFTGSRGDVGYTGSRVIAGSGFTDPNPEPEEPPLVRIRVAGMAFCCSCGCELFTQEYPDRYTCFACGSDYEEDF